MRATGRARSSAPNLPNLVCNMQCGHRVERYALGTWATTLAGASAKTGTGGALCVARTTCRLQINDLQTTINFVTSFVKRG
jgi:hypothetical protein